MWLLGVGGMSAPLLRALAAEQVLAPAAALNDAGHALIRA
jgi:hypothetical protein